MSRPQGRSKGPSKKRRKLSGVPAGWVEVAVAPNQIAGGMLESALKAEEIPVLLQKPPVFPFLGIGGQHLVLVPAECEEQAREILREIWDEPE